MSGLSMMQTRNLIDRLGDLDEEVTRVCKTGQTVAKGAPKGHSDETSRLKTAMKAAGECQAHVRMAKNALLEFDGFLQAQRPSLRQALMHPKLGGKTAGFIDQVARKVAPAMEHHVGGLAEEAVECIGRIQASLQALRVAEETDARSDDAKLSCKALEKTLMAAEKAIEKAVTYASAPAEHGYEHMHASGDEEEVEMVEEEVVEAKKATTHGYDLTAAAGSKKCEDLMEKVVGDDEGDDEGIEVSDKKAGKMPPQFAENAQKKKDEAAAKKDDDADADGEKDACNKSAKGKVPEAFLENIEKMKAKAKGKEEGDEKSDKSDKKAALPPEFLENIKKKKDEAAAKKDDEKSDKKAASAHGYQIHTPSEHGYELTT